MFPLSHSMKSSERPPSNRSFREAVRRVITAIIYDDLCGGREATERRSAETGLSKCRHAAIQLFEPINDDAQLRGRGFLFAALDHQKVLAVWSHVIVDVT